MHTELSHIYEEIIKYFDIEFSKLKVCLVHINFVHTYIKKLFLMQEFSRPTIISHMYTAKGFRVSTVFHCVILLAPFILKLVYYAHMIY